MYLVDTSVWIDYIGGRDRIHVRFLRDLLTNPLAVSITPLIYMEILQGARDPASFDRLQSYFGGQRFVDFDRPLDGHAAAAHLFMDCRRRGVTVRSSLDCLIAQCAMESDLILLHHDRDFRNIASVVPALKERNFLDSAGPPRDPHRIEDRALTPYESRLRAACRNALIQDFMTKSQQRLVTELKKNRHHWKMWVNKTGGNPYPPGDKRNKENKTGNKPKSLQGFEATTPTETDEELYERHARNRFNDEITFSLRWDANGNLVYPKTRKAQIAALELEIKRNRQPDGSLNGLGQLMQAHLDYINSQPTDGFRFVQEFKNGGTHHVAVGKDPGLMNLFEIVGEKDTRPLKAVFPNCLKFMPYAKPVGKQRKLSDERIGALYGEDALAEGPFFP